MLEVDSANNTPNSPSAVAPWKSFSVTRYLTDVKALYEAAEVNDPAAAALLLNKVDANVPHPKSLATPMHVAAESNAYAVISLLVAVGGNIEARERGIGATPLILAAQANATGAALALIRAGAHADSADMRDFTALHYAGLWHHPNLDPNVIFIIISTTAKNGNSLLALRLLKAGATVDMRSENGWTSLTCAVAFNWPVVASVLIKHGANTNNADTDGDTPLHLAASLGLVGLTQLLLSSGADTRIASQVPIIYLMPATYLWTHAQHRPVTRRCTLLAS